MTLTCTREPSRTREEPGEPAGLEVTESASSRFRAWVRHAPAERAPLPLIPAIWIATMVIHTAGVRGFYAGVVAALATAVAGWMGEHRSRNAEHKRLAGIEVAAVTAATGVWVTAGTQLGPLAGPDHLLSVLYLAATGGGYWWLRRHDAVQAARQRRDEAAAWEARKTDWHRLAPLLGLNGSHLLACNDTLLGDEMLIDTRGTGKRASQISGRDVAERLGEIEMIPTGRIDVSTDRLPGRLRISVRRKDPWAQALTHPAVDPSSPFARYVEEPASIRKPLVIGADPETGEPLTLTLWDEDEGGKVIGIFAKKGSGKSVNLSCITERITACPDAQLIQVNLGKHREDRRWAPLAAANALGRDQAGRARYLLQWVVEAIEARSRGGDDARVTPTPATPLLVVKIDEIDQVAADSVCRGLLDNIASKCRSEGVALIFAGQRATAQWMGGANLRANVDIAVLGRFARSGEARKAVGEEVDLPDMGEYGEGHPGVFLITELGGGGGYERGRVFNLHKPEDIDTIVARRAAARRPYVPDPALVSLSDLWAKATGDDEDQDDDGAGTAGRPASGRLIEGTEQITAKIGQARALTEEDLELPEIPPEMQAHAEEQREERRRQFFAVYTDVAIPDEHLTAVLAMLAAPGGTSTGAVAGALGVSRTTAHRYLTRLVLAGHAEVRGRGRGAGFHATGTTGHGGHLHLVPPPTGQAASDAL
jgi:hypothetical protein